MREEMITDVTNPNFNIVNVPFDNRLQCMEQIWNARDEGFISQHEALDIVCNQWHIQIKTSKLKR